MPGKSTSTTYGEGAGGTLLRVYYGEDDYSRAEAIRGLREALGDQDTASLNSTVIGADAASPAEVIAQASAVPFLGLGRLVVVDGLLTRFEPRRPNGARSAPPGLRRTRGSRTSGQQQSNSESGLGGWEAVAVAARSLPSSNSLVFSDGEVADSNPLLRLLAPVAEVRRFRPLSVSDAVTWVHRRVGQLGGRIEPAAANELGESAPENLWTLDAELSKLTLYVDDRTITTADVAELGTTVRKESIYMLIDAVVGGRYGGARIHLKRLLDSGETAPGVVNALAGQIRRLIVARDLTERRASQDQLADAIGTRSSLAIREAVARVGRFSLDRLIEMHGRLLEHELAFKTGQMDEKTSLELLLSELCEVAARGTVGQSGSASLRSF